MTEVIGSPAGKRQYCARELREEKKLKRHKSQIGATFIRATSGALMRVTVLLLLFTHQSWAGVICGCTRQDDSQHTCCPTAEHNDTAAEIHQGGLDAPASSHCPSEGATTPDFQFENLPQCATMCCYVAPQTDAQGVTVSSPNPQTVEDTLPLVHINAQTIPEPASFNTHQQHHKRPLYLAFSCWLI